MTSKRRKMDAHLTPPSSSVATTSSQPLKSSNCIETLSLQTDLDEGGSVLTTTSSSSSSTSTTSLVICKTNYSIDLLNRLNEMRNDRCLCDYEIRCNGHVYNVHKFILIAISDFFRAMLTGSMKESKENYVDLKGFNCTIGIESMLNYAYTGQLLVTFENIIFILDAASHLQINNAITLCREYLLSNVNKTNCVNILKIADRFSLCDVELNTKEFISKNFVQVYQDGGDQFIQLTHEQIITQLNSDCLQICSELDLFLMIVKWINGDKLNRLKYASSIIKNIRFMTMSAYELADYVENVDFMKEIPECYQYLVDAYRYHSLPNRQPLINNEQCKLRNKTALVAVGETNIFVLNELKQKWEIISSAPLEENYPYPFAAITINNYLYVLGTRRSASEEYRTCYRFSPRNLEWTQLSPLLHDRSRFGASVVGNYIYIFGGFEGFKRSNRVYLNAIERYSLENDVWEEFCNEGPQMSSMAACTYNNLIYFGGGKNMNWSKVSEFFCINVNTKEIIKKANMLTARTTHQITVCDERIIVIGGFDDAGNGILSIESYDVNLNQWTILTNIPGSISKTWPQSLGVVNGKFYISVFHTPNTFKIMQKGYYYDLYTNIWSEAPVVHERARYCPTCTLAFPRKVYKFGDSSDIIVNHEHTLIALNNNKINPSCSETIPFATTRLSSISSLCNVLTTTVNDEEVDDEDDDEDGAESSIHEHNYLSVVASTSKQASTSKMD